MIAAFDIESLKKRVPKAPLTHHFRADLDDITSSRKKRLDWLTCRGKEQERERERETEKIQVYGEACRVCNSQCVAVLPGLAVDIVR